MVKRIFCVIIFIPAIYYSMLWALVQYLRHGEVNLNNMPADRLARWAK